MPSTTHTAVMTVGRCLCRGGDNSTKTAEAVTVRPAWFVIVALGAATLTPGVVNGQTDRSCDPNGLDGLNTHLASSAQVAARYAPLYWFSPGERYLPTLPFFTAFDGIDNDPDYDSRFEGHTLDFGDPDEVAPLGPDGVPSPTALEDYYAEIDGRRSAVFYTVRDLSRREIQDMWQFLASDQQAWGRLFPLWRFGRPAGGIDIDRDILSTLEKDTPFQVIHYFSYFLHDGGLAGHPNDIERFSVVLPKDHDLAERFRLIIGGSTSRRVPNNALLLSGGDARRESGPDARPSVLVELGSHTSAPDVRPYGIYRPGSDVNWHVGHSWGVRDMQTSFGSPITGSYELWMSETRDRGTSRRLYPPVEDLFLMTGIDQESAQEKYSLVPFEPLACLFQLSEQIDDVPTGEQIDAADAIIGMMGEYGIWAWEFQGMSGLTEAQRGAAVGAIGRWHEDEVSEAWTDALDVSPKVMFRNHLFPPVFSVLQRPTAYFTQIHAWTTWYPGNALLVEIGYVVPKTYSPFVFPGYFEIRGGAYFQCRNVVNSCFASDRTFAMSAVQSGSYSDLMTWYGGLTWVRNRSRIDRDPSVSDFSLSGGLSAAPILRMKIRIGIRVDIHSTGPSPQNTLWEVQVGLRPLLRD